ncbi:MAG: DEAD/DEAH box helicase [DPANN group archaeon]|nr:DEAD/DEAH box helicase [DPANN group archaeon]
MDLDDVAELYPVLKPVIAAIKTKDKVKTLFPPQELAINSGYLDGKNMLLAIPTSTGKTLISELAMLKVILEQKKKALYLVPLKALAMEKYNNFKDKYESLGLKVVVSVGNFDNQDQWIKDYDIIITSVEKADSLMRHKAPWFDDIGIVVADEIHLLDDSSRGPTLEVVLTKIKSTINAQIIGLSATIGNKEELAGWLDAVLVESDFRPVVLFEGVQFDNSLIYKSRTDGNKIGLNDEIPLNKVLDGVLKSAKYVLDNKSQAIVFVSSKRGAESESEKIASITRNTLSFNEKTLLEKLSDSIEHALPSPTKQCKRLSKVVKNGVAFHHSGLMHKQRQLIEDAFKDGVIKIISATTTLAYGMNLPCDFCILRDVKRFYPSKGYAPIPILEYKQCAGRSGRIKYSKEGKSIILAKNENDANEISDYFIHGESENIYSKLAIEPVLRMHLLSLISTEHINSKEALETFIQNTFYAYQFQNLEELTSKIDSVLHKLTDYGFIESDNSKIFATEIGKRVSQLYIDPDTANMFITAIKRPFRSKDSVESVISNKSDLDEFKTGAEILEETSKILNHVSLIHLASYTIEMRPQLRINKDEQESFETYLESITRNILVEVPSMWDLKRTEFLQSLKTEMFFESWINEATDDTLFDRYKVSPGELRARLDKIDWLLYTLEEFSKMLKLSEVYFLAKNVRFRIKHGIKAELIPLVKLKGVGRVRARKLFSKGIRTNLDIQKTDILVLSQLIGNSLAAKLKGVEFDSSKASLELQINSNAQKSLEHFGKKKSI